MDLERELAQALQLVKDLGLQQKLSVSDVLQKVAAGCHNKPRADYGSKIPTDGR